MNKWKSFEFVERGFMSQWCRRKFSHLSISWPAIFKWKMKCIALQTLFNFIFNVKAQVMSWLKQWEVKQWNVEQKKHFKTLAFTNLPTPFLTFHCSCLQLCLTFKSIFASRYQTLDSFLEINNKAVYSVGTFRPSPFRTKQCTVLPSPTFLRQLFQQFLQIV